MPGKGDEGQFTRTLYILTFGMSRTEWKTKSLVGRKSSEQRNNHKQYGSSFSSPMQTSWQCHQTSLLQQPCTGVLFMLCMMSLIKSRWPILQSWTPCPTWRLRSIIPLVQSPPRMTSLTSPPSCPHRLPSPCWRMRPWTWRIRALLGKQTHRALHLGPSTP